LLPVPVVLPRPLIPPEATPPSRPLQEANLPTDTDASPTSGESGSKA